MHSNVHSGLIFIFADRLTGGGVAFINVYYYNLIWFEESIAFFDKNELLLIFQESLDFLPFFSLF